MKRFLEDEIVDSIDNLSLTEYGAYIKLFDAYTRGFGLPNGIDCLYRICGAVKPVERWAVKGVARRFFPVSETNGERHNPDADKIITEKKKRINASRLNGRKGGRPRSDQKGAEV